VAVYRFETWYLILREGNRLRVLRIGVLGVKFSPKRNEDVGGLRKLLNENLHKLYFSTSKIRMIWSRRLRRAGRVAQMGETRIAYRILVVKLQVKKLNLVGWIGLKWILEISDGL
jgi:hypothetical protein